MYPMSWVPEKFEIVSVAIFLPHALREWSFLRDQESDSCNFACAMTRGHNSVARPIFELLS